MVLTMDAKMMLIYLIASSALLLTLSFILQKNSWLNLLFKVLLFGVGLLGVVCLLFHLGFVIKS